MEENRQLDPEVKNLLERLIQIIDNTLVNSGEAREIMIALAKRETYIPAVGLYVITSPYVEKPEEEEEERKRLFFVDPEGTITEQRDDDWIKRMGIQIEGLD